MKTQIAFLASVVVAALSVAAGSETAEHRVELSPVADFRGVHISHLNGDLKIEGTDEEALRVVGERLDDGRRDKGPLPEGFRSLLGAGVDNTGLGVQVATEGDMISIVGSEVGEGADVSIFVPRSLGLNVTRAMDGDVSIRGMRGEINVTLHGGDLLLEDVSAPVVAHTVDSDVFISFSSFAGEKPSVINAVDGTVVISLPLNAAVNLELMTVTGDILTDLPVEVTQRNAHGFHGPQNVKATLNGGGTELKVHCVTDDILIKAAE